MAIQNEFFIKFIGIISPCLSSINRGVKGGRNPQVVNELADCRQALFYRFSVPATARKWTASQRRGILPGCPIWLWLWLCVWRPVWVATAAALNTRRERSRRGAG